MHPSLILRFLALLLSLSFTKCQKSAQPFNDVSEHETQKATILRQGELIKQQGELIEKLLREQTEMRQSLLDINSKLLETLEWKTTIEQWKNEFDGNQKGKHQQRDYVAKAQPQVVPNSEKNKKASAKKEDIATVSTSSQEKRGIRSDDTSPLEAVVSQLSQKMNDVTVQLQSYHDAISVASSSVYTRWGSDGCPSGSELAYSGLIGGAIHIHSGGATNSLCLPLNPLYQTNAHVNLLGNRHAGIYGTEYETYPEPSNNKKGVCAVCRSSRASVIMVPVSNACPSGWTLEYAGWIMSGLPVDGRSGTEYICVDSSLGGLLGSEHTDDSQHVLYYTKTFCGSLPCPPFVDGQVAECAVCSR